MTRRLRFLLGSALVVILTSATAMAQPGSRAVEVTVTGDAQDATPLVETLRELLGRQQLTVVPSADEGSVLARVHVDLLASRRAMVEVTGRGGRTILRREMPIEGTISREAIAHVVQEAVESELLAAPPPPASDAAVPPPPPDAAPPPRPPSVPLPTSSKPPIADERPRASSPSRLVLDVSMFGGVGPTASGSGPVPRVGASAAVAYASRFRPSIALQLAGAFPYERNAELVTARTSMLSGRLLPSIEIGRTEHFTFDAAVGGGLDIVTVTPRSDSLPASAVGSSTTRPSPIATGALSTRIDVVSSVVFFASLMVDVDPVRRSYVVAQGRGGTDTLVSPWIVRPTLLLGFAFTALGPPTFASTSASEGKAP